MQINRIKAVTLVIVLSIFFVACQSKKDDTVLLLKGALDYPTHRIANFYNQPDSLEQRFNHVLDSVGFEALMKEDSVFMTSYMVLKENDLLRSPFIYLKIDSLPSVIIYMDPEDYKPFTEFTYADLVKNQQKVSIALKAHNLYNNLYLCDGVESIEVVASDVPLRMGKFRAEDYR